LNHFDFSRKKLPILKERAVNKMPNIDIKLSVDQTGSSLYGNEVTSQKYHRCCSVKTGDDGI